MLIQVMMKVSELPNFKMLLREKKILRIIDIEIAYLTLLRALFKKTLIKSKMPYKNEKLIINL